MKVLVLGGNGFIGSHIVGSLVDKGHAVTTFSRSPPPKGLPAGVEGLRGDRDLGPSGIAALAGGSWEACVDTSGYTPRQVRPAVEALRGRVGRYLYVSAVMAYGDTQVRPVVEDHPLLPPAGEDVTEVDGDTYGPLKSACEGIVTGVLGGAATVFRPQVVTGPGDPSGRYAYWVQRAQRGGTMLAPGDGSDHLQLVDVRDLARFAALVLEKALPGAFNIAGPRITWSAFMGLLGHPDLAWVPSEILAEARLGFGDLPLYRPEHGRFSGLMDVSGDKARTHGLVLSDPASTLSGMRHWLEGREPPQALSPEREAALVRQAGLSPTSLAWPSRATRPRGSRP
jgi:2'-hydroxyisoflavone reductase